MNFGKEYTEYWASAVNKSVDGTVIAGLNEARYFMRYIELEKNHRVLDLGCSFGRMCEILTTYSDHVYGIDPDPFAVKKARHQPYEDVRQGTAEATGLNNEFFDFVFCWAVFDVVDHKKGLIEINRILRNGGKFLITGKNDNYHSDDELAFKAEKNAFLKGFPNKFTDLSVLLKNLKSFGIHIDKLYVFPRRGDFGLLNFSEPSKDDFSKNIGYEYLILGHKFADCQPTAVTKESLDGQFSKTATQMALQNGSNSAEKLFESIGID